MAEESRRRPWGGQGSGGDSDRGAYTKRSRYDAYHDEQPHHGRGSRFDDRRGSRHNEVMDEDLVMCPTYEQWRHRSPDNEGVSQYCEFVKDWVSKRGEEFVKRHWKEDWFLEKYDPERADARSRTRAEGVIQRARELDASRFVSLVKRSDKDKVVSGAETVLDEACCAYLPHVPPFIPRPALEKALQAEGAVSVFLSEVNRSKKRRDLGRRGTVLLRDSQAAKDCIAKGSVSCWVTMDPDGVNWESTSLKDDRRSEASITVLHYKSLPNRILPAEANNSERLDRDEKQAIACADVLDKTFQVEQANGIHAALAGKPESVSSLDAAIQYLRHVHFYCYYSGALCRDYGEFLHKAASPFLRVQPSSTATLTASSSSSGTATGPAGEGAGESETGNDQVETKEKLKASNEEVDPERGFGREHETDPRKFFEVVDFCVERIITFYAERHHIEQERLNDALQRRAQIANDALESFVAQSIVMKNSHVYCQIHDKLFQNEVFFRKHLLNFHGAAIRSTQRKALLDIFFEMFNHDEEKPLPRLPKFVEDALRGEFVPPPEREPRFSSGSAHGRFRREDGAPSEVRPSEPVVRRYRDPDAPSAEAVVEKPKKLQYRTRVSQPL